MPFRSSARSTAIALPSGRWSSPRPSTRLTVLRSIPASAASSSRLSPSAILAALNSLAVATISVEWHATALESSLSTICPKQENYAHVRIKLS